MLKRLILLVSTVSILVVSFGCNGNDNNNSELEAISTPPKIEVAGTNLDELIQLCGVVGEVIVYNEKSANQDQKQLLSQLTNILGTVKSDSKIDNIVLQKTEEERLILDFLEFTVGQLAQTYLQIPSTIASYVANKIEELSSLVGQWMEMNKIAYATITLQDIGTIGIVYQRELKEVWVNCNVSNPAGLVNMYSPVEITELQPDNAGSSAAAILLKPILENSRVAYKFGIFPTSTTTTMKPSTMAVTSTPATSTTEALPRITFASEGHVFVINPDGTGMVDLGSGSNHEWSPNGKRIAYQPVDRQLFLINADGTGKVDLGEAEYYKWSPDGERILYEKSEGTILYPNSEDGVYVFESDVAGIVKLDEGSYFDWAPTGEWIAYINEYDNLCLVKPDGSNLVRLLPEINRFQWSTDGTKIAYLPAWGMFISYKILGFINVDGTGNVKLEGWWSPDGNKIAYLPGNSINELKIREFSPTGNTVKDVTMFTSTFGATVSDRVIWSPDGKRILYSLWGSAQQTEYLGYHVINTETLEDIYLGGSDVDIPDSCWSPDGRWLAYNVEGEDHVYVIDFNMGNKIKLEGTKLLWSPDGKRVALERLEKFGKEVTGESIAIVNPDGTSEIETPGQSPVWSPDGRKITYTYEGNVWVMNTDGTDAIKLAAGSNPKWSPLPTPTPTPATPITTYAPTPTAPTNGQIVLTTRPAFAWTPVSGTTMYQFELTENIDFVTSIYAVDTAVAGILLPDNVILERGKSYFWRVRSLQPVESHWSIIADFMITLEANDTPPIQVLP